MKLGVNVGYWGLGLTSEQQLEIVQEAERIGYDSVWAAEAYGSDTATVLAWLAAGTERIHLCSGIFQMPARSPAMTAMTAATIDQLSGGRFRLGLGPSGPQVSEGWHGVRFARQLQRTREYVEVVRMALAPRAPRVSRRDDRAAAARWPGQGAQADDLPGPGGDPHLPRRDRAEERRADRRDRRRLAPRLPRPRAPRRADGAARGGRAAGRARPGRLRHRADGQRTHLRRRRGGPRRHAPHPRPVRRRHGLAGEELLQRARAALRVRGRGARGAGPVPRRQEGGGRGGAAGRADRHGHAVRPRRTGSATGSPSTPRPASGTLGVSPMAFDAESRLEQLRLVAELAEAAAAV